VIVDGSRGVRLLVSLALLLMVLWTTSCGSGTMNAAPSPRPAVSVSVLPDVEAGRVVTVFLRDRATGAQKLAMAEEIAQMPEVEAYRFVSKRQALESFAAQRPDLDLENLPMNPLPASFQLVVRDGADVASVAQRFYEDPIVANTPGTHDGVAVGGTVPAGMSPSP